MTHIVYAKCEQCKKEERCADVTRLPTVELDKSAWLSVINADFSGVSRTNYSFCSPSCLSLWAMNEVKEEALRIKRVLDMRTEDGGHK